MKKKDILRIVDANLNRLREALRVCEEVSRFTVEDRASTAELKRIRHKVAEIFTRPSGFKYSLLISSRNIKEDVGRQTIPHELKRNGVWDVLGANFERAKESIRVLEEFFKLIDRKSAQSFKDIRYDIYKIEKVLIEKT